jgi:hypothetical protein
MTGKADVDAGICGFGAYIVADAEDMMGSAKVSIKTECPNLRKLGESLDVDIMDLMKNGCGSEAHKQITDAVPALHCPCPVTLALLQAVKVAAGLALPKDIKIVLTKDRSEGITQT